MLNLAHVVALLDSSDSAATALRVAQHLSTTYGAQLDSVHVVPKIPPLLQRVLLPYAALGEDLAELEQEMLTVARSEMRRLLKTESQGDNPHPTSVLCDQVGVGLIRELGRLQADLVVMGACSQHDSGQNHLGHISRWLVERWDGPILLVRDTISQTPLDEITLVTDFATQSDQLVSLACGLAIRLNLPLSVLTVVPDPRIQDRGGFLKGLVKVDQRTFLSRGKRTAGRQLDRILKGLQFPYPDQEAFAKLEHELVVLFGDPCEQLIEYAGEHDDLLLVVGRSEGASSQTKTLGRTSESILRRVPAHVLVVP